jgi:hypothetical protein
MGLTLMLWAVPLANGTLGSSNHSEIVRLLLENGADSEARGGTLSTAQRYGYIATLQVILGKKKNLRPRVKNNDLESPALRITTSLGK